MNNKHILDVIYDIIMWDRELKHKMIGWEQSTLHIQDLFSPLEQRITAIDDQYIRTQHSIYRRAGLADILNTSDIEYMNEENEELVANKPEPTYKIGKVYRFAAADKLKTLNLLDVFKQVMGTHVQCLWETKPPTWTVVFEYNIPNAVMVYVLNADDDLMYVPEMVLIPTTVKCHKEIEHQKEYERVVEILKNRTRADTKQLTEIYQTQLKAFMQASKTLTQAMNTNIEQQAKRLMETRKIIKTELIKNEQINNVEYIPGEQLVIYTEPLRLTIEHSEQAIGRYKIKINLKERAVKIYNEDINNEGVHQHPHVYSGWYCCFWWYESELRKSWDFEDYITLVYTLLEYLQDYNGDSVYITIDDFIDEHYKKFEYQIKAKAEAKEKEIEKTKLLIDLETTDGKENVTS